MNRKPLRSLIGLACLSGLLSGGLLTASAQATPSATASPAPTSTPTTTPTVTATPTPQGSLMIIQVAGGEDDVNESGGQLAADLTELWAGNAGTTSGHYLGLRFTDVPIPPGSVIHAAYLEVYTTSEQWIRLAYDLAAEAADDSAPFDTDDLPSQRELTDAVVNHESDVQWRADGWYPLAEVSALVREVIERPGWQMGGSLSFIAQGTEAGGSFGRKFFAAYEIDERAAPRLVIDLTPGEIPPTPHVPTPTTTPDPCSAVPLPIRLEAGGRGQVTPNTAAPSTPLNVRESPGLDVERTARLAVGVTFAVITGPVCVDEIAWFQVRFGPPIKTGWIAEGQGGVYFVEPAR